MEESLTFRNFVCVVVVRMVVAMFPFSELSLNNWELAALKESNEKKTRKMAFRIIATFVFLPCFLANVQVHYSVASMLHCTMLFHPLDFISPPTRAHDDEPDQSEAILRHSPAEKEPALESIPSPQLYSSHASDPNDSDPDLAEVDPTTPLHINDLPMLHLRPPAAVLLLFLHLLAPDQVLNFASSEPETDPESIFVKKNALGFMPEALPWIQTYCPRFVTRPLLASVSFLAETLRKGFMSEYNAWLTQVVASELLWTEILQREEIQRLAALRLAENCGRTAHPEILRVISIPLLEQHLHLKEPSLTGDNLGLKTWGSSFLLGSRLAHSAQNYLVSPVLELGAGTGLVGMVACIRGCKTTLTDLPEIVPNLRENVELNGLDAVVDTLDWLDPAAFVQKYHSPKYNTIVLSDPLYSPKHLQLIVDMVNLFLSNDPLAAVLLQVPLRRNFESERATLWALMDQNGYVAKEQETEDGHDDFGESQFLFRKYIRK